MGSKKPELIKYVSVKLNSQQSGWTEMRIVNTHQKQYVLGDQIVYETVQGVDAMKEQRWRPSTDVEKMALLDHLCREMEP